jgi:hypothetical protein
MLVIVLTLVPVYAQRPSTPTTTTPSQDGTDQLTEYQREMLRIENAKLEQQEKARFYTVATIVLTALIEFATVVSTIQNANSQASNQAKLANEQAQLLAKLKALEIVTNAPGPSAARHRYRIVKKLLGEKLLGEKLLGEESPGEEPSMEDFAGVGPGHDQSRKELIQMLLEYPERQAEVLCFWEIAFKENKSL